MKKNKMVNAAHDENDELSKHGPRVKKLILRQRDGSWDALNKEFQYLWRKFERTGGCNNVEDYCVALETMVINFLCKNNTLNSKESN